MTDQTIDLTQLRADYEGWTGIVEIEVDTALALIDVAEAAHELFMDGDYTDAAHAFKADPHGLIPELATLQRFTFEQPTP